MASNGMMFLLSFINTSEFVEIYCGRGHRDT